ncbi:MAG: ATP-binding protein [Candidatus Cryptobacteroides sp.]
METLFERHLEYLSDVPTLFERELMKTIDWDSRLILIRGPKGVGKSTLMLQLILKKYGVSDRHVLYCSADTGYFTTHTLVDTAAAFVRQGGTHLFIDEIHKYDGWSREIKEIYDLFKHLSVVLSGSSLIQLNDGETDLSRRQDIYDMPGLSFREYLWFRTGREVSPVTLDELLANPAGFCMKVRKEFRPLEFFQDYLKSGYYPFSFEKKRTYKTVIENVINYTIDTELTKYRNVSIENTGKIKAFLQVVSGLLPYQVDIAKLSKSVGIDRVTLLRYMKHLAEAKLTRNVYARQDTITDLQKPEKLMLDNTNQIFSLCSKEPEIGTLRECFFCNQLASAGHKVEYGVKTGDFRIDNDIVIEVGGASKGMAQISDEDKDKAALAVDDIDMAAGNKIPLWAFGFLY